MFYADVLGPRATTDTRRFAVAWRNRRERVITPVAVLDHRGVGYRFQYLRDIEAVNGFRPFVGFQDLDRIYESPRLWPFFDLRVMDRKRPDFTEYVRWLGLTAEASRLDILSRSGGEQKGDSVYLAESPAVADDGATEAVFLVRGSSYATQQYNTETAANALRAGEELQIVRDETNEANPQALLLVTAGGAEVGWVPDLLIGYVREVGDRGGRIRLEQNNGTSAPWHARLLVHVSGNVEPGALSFIGGAWPPLD